MTVNINREYFSIWILSLSIISFFQVMEVYGEDSIELDYADEGNSSLSYDYEEESSIEKIKRKSSSSSSLAPIRVISPPMHGIVTNQDHPKMMPLFDKDGKRLGSQEIYADINAGSVKKMYYDSDGKRITIPILLRDEDLNEANLTSILDWIDWLDGMKTTLMDMKEKASSCSTNSYEELKGYASVSAMLKDIEHAVQTVDNCEQKLNKQLRDPEKQWNYPSEKKSGPG